MGGAAGAGDIGVNVTDVDDLARLAACGRLQKQQQCGQIWTTTV